MTGHRLLIPTPAQAERYLAQRRDMGDLSGKDRLLHERATAFWLCVQARESGGPHTHWALFPPRGGPLPRLHMVPAGGIGLPIQRHPSLVQSLGFATPSLRTHGALWIAWPVCQKEVDRAFGAGAWKESQRSEAMERQVAMEKALGQPNGCMAKERL